MLSWGREADSECSGVREVTFESTLCWVVCCVSVSADEACSNCFLFCFCDFPATVETVAGELVSTVGLFCPFRAACFPTAFAFALAFAFAAAFKFLFCGTVSSSDDEEDCLFDVFLFEVEGERGGVVDAEVSFLSFISAAE